MSLIQIPLNLNAIAVDEADKHLIEEALKCQQTAAELYDEERFTDALERTVNALHTLHDFSDFDNIEFRTLQASLLYNLSQLHYDLKDYKQSEKDLDLLFKLLENMLKNNPDRFGKYHVLAMELSTRILRSRKKTLELLVKQQINAGALYEKVNSGVVAATDRLVESLRNIGELLASSGDYKGAMKFYTEAIKISKKRTGRVTRKEVKMTIEMARIMMRVNSMRPRAKRLLNAILPHAIALETIELEEEIIALIEIIDTNLEQEPKWKAFVHKLTAGAKNKLRKKSKAENDENPAQDEQQDAQQEDK